MCTLAPHAFVGLRVCWHGVACLAYQSVSEQSNNHRLMSLAGMRKQLYPADCKWLEAQQYMHSRTCTAQG